MTYEFTVPGPIVGAVRTTQRQKWVDPRYKKYRAWKDAVRLLANKAKVPAEIPKGMIARISIHVCWTKRPRADLDNVIKGIIDSLWKQDRRVERIFAENHRRCAKEQVFIITGFVGEGE